MFKKGGNREKKLTNRPSVPSREAIELATMPIQALALGHYSPQYEACEHLLHKQ